MRRRRASSVLRRRALGCAFAALLGMLVVAPWAGAAAAGVDITAVEGQSFTGNVVGGLTCPLMSATVTWGDGAAPSAGASDGTTGIRGTHSYAEEGTYSGSVSYTYVTFRSCPTGTQTATFQATVRDAPLAAAGVDISGVAGQSLSAVVTHIADVNPSGSANDFAAQIDWGDGSSSSGSLSPAAAGFDVTGTHTYATAGSYPVNTTITDVGGSGTTATSTAQIAAPAAMPPRIITVPVVSGPPHESDTLSTTTGFWSGSPIDFQYQWLRCATPTGDSCVVLAGATTSTYTLVHADVGSTMRARVRASNEVGTSLPADSAPTAAVKPLVLTARFTLTPNPTCTGVRVSFDASATETPNPPIERYRFTESVQDYAPLDPFLQTPPPAPWVVADGTNPRATEVPTYDLQFGDPFPLVPALAGLWQASPRTITLTVRDRAGASASYTQYLHFNPALSNQSRAGCPRADQVPKRHLVLRDVKLRATSKALTAQISCATTTDCVGTLHVFRAFSRSGRHLKPVLIGSSTFYVAGHHAATVTAKLTAAGRSLLRHGNPIAAIEKLSSVGPTGPTIKQSLKVTLIGKRTRR